MNFFVQRDRNKQTKHAKTNNRKQGLWQKTLCLLLCIALFGTNMGGISTIAAAAEDTANVLADTENVEKIPEDAAPPDNDIIGWTWTDEKGILHENEGEWYLTLPDMELKDVTEEQLPEMLPKEISVTMTDGTTETLPITWDMSALQEISAANEVCPLTANLPEGYTFQEGTAQPRVVFVQQESKPSDNDIAAWEWVDEEEFLTEYEGEWYLSLPGATAEDLTEELLNGMLPQALAVTLGDGTTETLPVTWDMSVLWEASATNGLYRLNAALLDEYRLKDGVKAPYVLLEYGGAEVYANFPGNRRGLTKDELNQELAEHQVHGITPAGTTINLFDYVADNDGAKVRDLTNKGSILNGYYSVAKSDEWNKGINKNRLLIFGDSIIGAGYWNNGAGAGRKWARENTNTKGIVEPVLVDGYPNINIKNANKTIANAENYKEFELPFCLGWAADEDNELDDPRDAPALSEKVIDNNKRHYGTTGTSLDYLFNPTINLGDNVKRSYKNVTGLFQVDEDGYYYYDARKNFAEFQKSTDDASTKDGRTSDGSFILYDGPAVWRTDAGWNKDTQSFNGDKSLGNFYPFNTGEQVFDCIDENKSCLSSSSEGFDGGKWGSENFRNQATNKDVFINHHIGMTMEVNFTQPEDGKLNMGSAGKKPMIFQFSGDDDVWIFIDDVLVLDLGGIHSELYGTINFDTGEIITGQSWRTGGLPENPGKMEGDEEPSSLYDKFVEALGKDGADARGWTTSSTGDNIFRTGTEHTLKLFYLERGNYDSSLQMRFNLQPSLAHSIKKVDQNGNPLEGVTFELYEAEATKEGGVDVADYKTTSGVIATLTTGKDGKTDFVRTDGSPFSFTDRYHSKSTEYYILKETHTAGGYRSLPHDIVLKFDVGNSMLVVQNRYQTGAYASFLSNINETGKLTYGKFNTDNGVIKPSDTELSQNSKKDGLIIAVPMLYENSSKKWNCLYGSNTVGYGAVVPEVRTAEAWRKAVLKAALYQASDERWPEWRLTYNQDTGKLEGLLEDLPGRSDRYALNNENGDMKMVYGVIEPSALNKLDIAGTTSAELYDALENYVANAIKKGAANSKSTDEVIDEIIAQLKITQENFNDRDFSFLDTDQFQREFRSIIYIPNERRELRVWKVDEDGKGVNEVQFTLYNTKNDGTISDAVVSGVTANVDDRDGVLIFRPGAEQNANGYANITWGDVDSRYILKETNPPAGYEKNETEIPVVVGIYSIYADAGSKDDGVTVMAGVGKLMQTMTKYAADDMVNITLRDITAIAQTQESGTFDLNGWEDALLADTEISRSMNLHYGRNAVVDYGLHDEDGGEFIYPFFTADEGFLRTRVEQNTAALQDNLYEGSSNTANWDNLKGRHLTSLFSLLNTVVVTDKKTLPDDNTGKLRISKTVSGTVTNSDYTQKFIFTVSLKKADGTALSDKYYYYGEQLAGYIKDGETLPLHHDEAVTILGLPSGTKWEITEKPKDGWSVSPQSGVINGTIETDKTSNAEFTNTKTSGGGGGDPGVDPGAGKGNLTVSKTVTGNQGDTNKAFNFTVTLSDTSIKGTYGDMTFTDGIATFTLKHGESKTAIDLPPGVRYEVTETEANQDGYTTTASGEKGNIAEGVTQKAIFTNTKNIRPTDPVTPITPDDPTAPTNPTNPDNPEIPTEPTEPGTHTDPDTPSVVTDEAVKTGDEANAVLWLMLMGISLIGVICAGRVSKKQGKHSK